WWARFGRWDGSSTRGAARPRRRLSNATGLCETACMSRSSLVAAGVTASAVVAAAIHAGAGGAAAPARWSGAASCTIGTTGPGYQHTETQRWQVGGRQTVSGAFRFVPSRWTDTGSGSSHVTQGDQTRDITWTVKAAATGKFKFVVRASDGKLLI